MQKIIKIEARSISEFSEDMGSTSGVAILRTLLVQGRISALGVAAEGRKLWEMTMICQICGKVAVMC